MFFVYDRPFLRHRSSRRRSVYRRHWADRRHLPKVWFKFSARSRCGRLTADEIRWVQPGSVRWSARKHVQVRTESAPTPRQRSAQARATPTEIVRREFAYVNFRCELLDDVPDELLGHPFAPNLASAIHAAEEAAIGDSSSLHPVVQEPPHPIGDRDGPNGHGLGSHSRSS